MTLPDTSWLDRAACARLPVRVWDAMIDSALNGNPTAHEQARKICATCPVRARCYKEGLAHGDRTSWRAGQAMSARRPLKTTCACGVPTWRSCAVCAGCAPDGRQVHKLART